MDGVKSLDEMRLMLLCHWMGGGMVAGDAAKVDMLGSRELYSFVSLMRTQAGSSSRQVVFKL